MMQYQFSMHMRSSLQSSHLYETSIGLILDIHKRAIINDLNDVALYDVLCVCVCGGYR